jgi:hypothetical protein
MRTAAMMALLFAGSALLGQNPTAGGVINGTLVNKSGISLVFNSDPQSVTLGGAGTSAASLNFGNISAFGPLATGVTRPAVTATNYTVRALFDVQVTQGGLTSTTYTLQAQLAGPTPTGLSYRVDAITLSTAFQTLQTNGAYDANVQHSLDLVVLKAAPGAGGPATGTALTTTINFTATAN